MRDLPDDIQNYIYKIYFSENVLDKIKWIDGSVYPDVRIVFLRYKIRFSIDNKILSYI